MFKTTTSLLWSRTAAATRGASSSVSSSSASSSSSSSSSQQQLHLKQAALVSAAVSATTFATQWHFHQKQKRKKQDSPSVTPASAKKTSPFLRPPKPIQLVTPLMTSSYYLDQYLHFLPSMTTYCDSEHVNGGGSGGGMDGGTMGNGNHSNQLLNDNDSTMEDDDKTTFFGQCLQRQLYRPKLPYPAWDYDWDHRETEATSQQALSAAGQFAKSRHLGKTRHLILIRHGQYDERYKDDRRRKLTPLGRHQAELTGQRLAIYARGGMGTMKREYGGPLNIKCIHVSDMERAKETARIIASHLPHVKVNEPDPMLNEALPAPMIPIRPDIRAVREIDANHSRIEAAFQKYIHRADLHEEDEHDYAHQAHQQQQQQQQKQQHQLQQQQQQRGGGSSSSSSDHHHHDDHHHDPLDPHTPQDPSHAIFPHPEHEFEILVGHGNIIRYFFCRSLQLPPEAWLRISTFNCSITYLMIYPNGYVSCRMLGDVGHLGYDNTTFSGSYGYNW